MKEEFRREQQINHRHREEIKKCEMDRFRILERLNLLRRNGRSQKIIEIQMFEIQELQAGNFEIE